MALRVYKRGLIASSHRKVILRTSIQEVACSATLPVLEYKSAQLWCWGEQKRLRPSRIRDMLMATQEDIGGEVRMIGLNDPKNLLRFVENPYNFDALVKLKDNYTGNWRDKIVAFCDTLKETYDVEHIKQEATTALQSQTKMQKFFSNIVLFVFIAVGMGVAWWQLFNLWTGILLAVALLVCFVIGNDAAMKETKKFFSGDTLRIVDDFNKITK